MFPNQKLPTVRLPVAVYRLAPTPGKVRRLFFPNGMKLSQINICSSSMAERDGRVLRVSKPSNTSSIGPVGKPTDPCAVPGNDGEPLI